MPRTVTINGKAIPLETGVKPAPLGRFGGRGKSDFRQAVEAMRPGESFVVPLSSTEMTSKANTMSLAAKTTGHQYSYRKDGSGYRIFCQRKTAKASRDLEAV